MKKLNILLIGLFSLVLAIVPLNIVNAEEGITPAAAAYQCIKCGSHQVTWHKHYYTGWQDYFLNGRCSHGKSGYVDVTQRMYYNQYLSCSACGADFKDGTTGYDERTICRKGA